MQRSSAQALALAAIALVSPCLGPFAVAAFLLPSHAALAQPAGKGGPPAVGVAPIRHRDVTSSADYVGRIQAIDRVALIARVTAYLDKRLFEEGAEVKQGDLLYVLEQGPFQAQVLAQQGALAQAQATVINARVNFQRQAALLKTPAGQQQAYDNAQATAQGGAANVLTAQGNLQSAQIQLGYTEIRAPVDGRITATAVNRGNVVSPSSGTLATIVTQDPMYVTFPVSTRDVLSLQTKYQASGGLAQAVIRVTLGDGKVYDHAGRLDYVSPTVSNQTDTITLRATLANPKRDQPASQPASQPAGQLTGQPGAQPSGQPAAGVSSRQLVDGEFVTVTVSDPHPVDQIVVPRAAVLSDQQGDYVFVVNAQNKAIRTDVTLGESSGADTVVLTGLKDGDNIVVDGLQRVHPGAAVTPKPPLAGPDVNGGSQSGAGAPGGTPQKTGDAAAAQGSPAPASNAAPSQR